jgi:hypothetical protein
MIISRQQRSVAAARVALGLIVATLVIGPSADAASTHTSMDRNPPGPVYPGTFSEYQDPAEYQKPAYPNHRPLRGNYPGSYPSSPSTPVQQPSSQFDWLAALVGAAGMLGLILLLTAVKAGARRARNRRQGVPLVVQIDEPPSVG